MEVGTGASSSVAARPDARSASPEVTSSSRLEPRERGAERLNGALVDLAVLLKSREIVDKRGVNHAIGHGRAAAQTVEILQVSAKHFGTSGDKGSGRFTTDQIGGDLTPEFLATLS